MQYSYHVHSSYSDGKATIDEIIHYAKKIGLDEIGFSDHLHVSDDGFLFPGDMKPERLDDYVRDVLSYSSNIKPKVKLGLEAEFVFNAINRLDKVISKYPFDYVIGSAHRLIMTARVSKLSQNSINTLVKQYWAVIKQLAESKMFDIVGHLDFFKCFKLNPTIDVSKEIDLALESVKKSDLAVEVNTSGWYLPCEEQYPSVCILEKCKKLDIPIIITADAHQPRNLTRGFEKAVGLVKKLGYKKQAYFVKRKRFFANL